MKTNLFSVFLILAFVIACTTNKDSQSGKQTIDLSKILQNPNNDKIFKGVRYVKLESNPDIMLGDDLYFEIQNGNLYILDRKNQKAVLIFDKSGNFKNKVGKPGKGPEEYVRPVDFLIRNDTIDILSNTGKSTIYSYKENGDFIQKKELNYAALSFQFIQDQYYAIYTSYNKSMHDYRLYLLDRKGNEIKKLLPNNTKLNIPAGEQSFSLCDNQVFYFEPFNDTIYTLQTSGVKPFYVLDFGRYNIPKEFFQKELTEGFTMINKQGFSVIKNVFANQKNMIFEITRQQEGVAPGVFLIVYNKKTQNLENITATEDNTIFRYPIGLNDNNEMMYLVFPMGDITKEFSKYGLDLSIPDFKESDNPAIVFCELK